MFPIYDSIPASKTPVLTYLLIAVTIVVFILQLTTADPEAFIGQFALIPSQVNWSNFTTLLPFVTAIFLHGGFLHIISNMWFLKVFGDNVEDNLSPLSFLALFFVSGIVGFIVQYLLMPTSSIPMLGASGAVAGILGAYYTWYPHSRVKTLIFIFFFVTIIDISAAFMLGYWFLLQLFNGIGSIHASTATTQGGIAFWAHVGGFITGVLWAKLFARRNSEVLEGEVVR